MKKTLIALAAVAASGMAMAQSSVTLFGVVDLGVSYNKDTDTMGDANDTWKRSGMKSVLSGSRFGMRGAEDLGGGLKADFMLEYGVQPDEATTSMANRQAWVGLGGGFGTVKLGRQYTPFHNVQAAIDVAGNADAPGYVLALHNRARASNAIRYDMPSMSGFNAAIMYGFGENSRKNGKQTEGDSWGLNATYSTGPLLVGFAYDQVRRPSAAVISYGGMAGMPSSVLFGDAVSTKSIVDLDKCDINDICPVSTLTSIDRNSKKVATWALGGAYDFGVAKVTFGYSELKDTGNDAVDDGNLKSKGWLLGVSVPMGATTLYAGYGQAKIKDNDPVSGDDKYRGYQLGVNYALSKRTTAYALYGADRLRTVGESGSVKRSQVSVGVRHTF